MDINEQLIEELSKALLKLVKDQTKEGAKVNSNILKEAREWIKQLGLELPHPTDTSHSGKLREYLSGLPSYDENYMQ